ncbi:phosphatase PAP2 family protein [Pseudarthrobacter sp. J75]|uniref:phosphatase PAP2 family protein n=1 Tax=unclassified Pseudarthrobacter TaxID=2647000 RepID=UPI002E81C175|nr:MULTISPECIES: phosphatase PAP2 family protein [unclassified Pseudarthrobacter]MEE2523979.1 phosphatase PAP2 family protein [Pseudarthrobacter sp. J47]MEE2528253.1 phosphatase PAP2 family protein [Pseudarthrobacter sp. J75]
MTVSRGVQPAAPVRLPAVQQAVSGLLFLTATLACAAGLFATYFFFVQTTTGQFIDESALVEAVDFHGPAGKVSTRFLDWLPTISLVVAAAVVLFVSLVRRRWKAAGIAVGACICANVATQVLKNMLPERPDKGVVTIDLNSLPSGHTTLAASAAAAVFLMSSPRWRPLAGFLGGTFAIISGASTLVNQWHRPADVVAAFLLVGVFMIPAGWLIVGTGGAWNVWDGMGRHWGSARIWLTLPVALGVASALVAVYSLAQIAPGSGPAASTTSYFWAGLALIVITGYLATVATTSLFSYAVRRR